MCQPLDVYLHHSYSGTNPGLDVSKILSAEPTSDRLPSTEVVTKVAAVKGVSPIDIQPPLYEAIDPSALDALFSDRSGGSCVEQVSFQYNGFDVIVEDGGEVFVSETGETA